MYSLFIVYILLLAFGTSINLPLFGKEVQLADLLFIFIFAKVLWGIRKDSAGKIFKPIPAIGYLVVILISLLLAASWFSSDRIKSLVEFFSILYLVVLYSWVSRIDMQPLQLKRVFNIWLYLTGLVCLLGLGGLIVYIVSGKDNLFVIVCPQIESLIPFVRISTTFPTMNIFSSYLHTGIVFLLALFIHNKRGWDYLLLCVLIFLCMFLAISRNLLGIFITIFLAIIPIRGRPLFCIFRYISFGFILLLLASVLATTIWTIYPVKTSYDKDSNIFNLSLNTSLNLYTILNKVSIGLIRRNPLAGVGPGMFNKVTIEEIDWEEVKDTYEAEGFHDKFVSFDPHSTYLGWAAEAGLPFIIVLIGLLCVIGRVLWKAYRTNSDSFLGWFSYVCLCGLIGFMINGLYVDILTMRHFWVMLGLGTMAALQCLET